MIYWLIYGILLLGGSLFFLAPFFLFRRGGRRPSKRQSLLENISLSLLMLFLTFMAVEFYFKVFFAQSDGFRYTLASQNWYDRYWEENSLGYRDVAWTPELLAGKTKVMVVGDSFTAGAGIANPTDRFADQLGRRLGDNFAILNVASPGWDTIDEVEAIVDYPYRPDILVLAYYLNDIEGVAYVTGAQRPQLRRDPPAWLAPLVQNSYAVNFLYWRLARLGLQAWGTIYWEDWLKKIAADPEIRWRHEQELLTIAEGAASEQIPLFVVVFPNLTAVEESAFMTQPVIDLFRQRDIPVLDVSELLAGLNPAETTVNTVDSHPNERVHALVAEQLFEMIRACPADPCRLAGSQ